MKSSRSFRTAGVIAVIAALAACTKTPPPPPPPPPPPVVVIPPQPQPPNGAAPNITVPPLDAMGVRHTVNVDISPAEITWNMRSAYNVAALNCMRPEHAAILANYRIFLQAHAKRLAAVNKALDREFKDRYGPEAVRSREAYMTRVYNYFAQPPTLPAFCDAALLMSNQALTVAPADLDAFAARSLPQLEQVFTEFYSSYDQYRADLAAWQARYMAQGTPPPLSAALPLAPTLAETQTPGQAPRR